MKTFFTILSVLLFMISFSQNIEFKKKNFDSPEQFEKAKAALEKGDEFFFAGNFEKAVSPFKEAQELNPNNALLNFKIGACYLKNDELEKSMPYFEKAQKLNPKVDPKINFALAQSYQANAKYDDAIESYNLYLEGLSKNAKVSENDKVQKNIDICMAELQKAKAKVEEKKELAKVEAPPVKEEKVEAKPVEKKTEIVAPVKEKKTSPKVEEKVSSTSKPINKTTTKPIAKPKADQITYRIQISSSAQVATASQLKSIYSGTLKITEEKVGNLYKYYIGDFSSKAEAMKAKSLSGVSGAFLVRFKNGKKI